MKSFSVKRIAGKAILPGTGTGNGAPAKRLTLTLTRGGRKLKVNLTAPARAPETLVCVAALLHGGRSTQVWDATVSRQRDGRPIAHFRCTRYLLAAER
ncbi:MAG: PaaI family thioesterase [Solirubrobacterales bacterium]